MTAVAEKFTATMRAASSVTEKLKATGSKATNTVAAGWSKVIGKLKSVIVGARQLGSSIEQLKSKLSMAQVGMQKTTVGTNP